MKIALGTDHAGFPYKEEVKKLLESLGHEVRDFGTFSTDQVDYPVFVRPAAEAVASGECERGVVFGARGMVKRWQPIVSKESAVPSAGTWRAPALLASTTTPT